jgi:hypothetical protein
MEGKAGREFDERLTARPSARRGVDVLLKKAAVDPAFKKLLFEKRGAAAQAIGLKLDAAEAALIEAVPESQLDAVIARTAVSPKIRPAFLGCAAGVMLAALGATTACDGLTDATFGNRPDPPPPTGTAEPAASRDARGAKAVGGDPREIDREVDR